MTTNSTYRIGAGSGFAGDRYEPAELLAEHGELDALVFECLAERTIALAQHDARSGKSAGYDPRILRRLRGTLPQMLSRSGTTLTNAGAANPTAGAKAVKTLARELGHPTATIAAVSNDDVLELLDLKNSRIIGTDDTLYDIRDRLVSANAYLGITGILEALDAGSQVVITGRVGDASLFLAPIAHHHGWDRNNLDLLAEGTLVGHLLECSGQLTGGYFADGNAKKVPGLSMLGFPFADVEETGAATFGKVAGTGGLLDRRTTLEQLLYEIDDPACYLTPDVALDLSHVTITETGPDQVRVSGARQVGVPPTLKVSVGVQDGYLAIAEISYAGAGCLQRARMAYEIINERWREVYGYATDELRCDYLGQNASRPWWTSDTEPMEVRARMSVRTFDYSKAVTLGEEVEALYTNGPSGGGGATSSIIETIGIVSTLIPREAVTPKVELFR
ncbi:acyclic terpene utilization AtuA family protein [Paenarthrobacter sp. NPDC091669]|uniref:acyclic terpene utilization AtuA family protein n=1 Tax=Paenarthrobacter sp. NPDC091669 TaxID=3364384 RepID=UPI00380E22A8